MLCRVCLLLNVKLLTASTTGASPSLIDRGSLNDSVTLHSVMSSAGERRVRRPAPLPRTKSSKMRLFRRFSENLRTRVDLVPDPPLDSFRPHRSSALKHWVKNRKVYIVPIEPDESLVEKVCRCLVVCVNPCRGASSEGIPSSLPRLGSVLITKGLDEIADRFFVRECHRCCLIVFSELMVIDSIIDRSVRPFLKKGKAIAFPDGFDETIREKLCSPIQTLGAKFRLEYKRLSGEDRERLRGLYLIDNLEKIRADIEEILPLGSKRLAKNWPELSMSVASQLQSIAGKLLTYLESGEVITVFMIFKCIRPRRRVEIIKRKGKSVVVQDFEMMSRGRED
jgi:hypothetical protein